MSASWYDVLGVDETATTEEIRAAWRESIVDLEPGDRRFRMYNEAAEVLLDDDRRAEYDAELAAATPAPATPAPEPAADEAAGATPEPADDPTAAQVPEAAAVPVAEPADVRTDEPAGEREPATADAARSVPRVPGWLLAGLAVMLVVAAGLAAYFQFTGDDAAAAEDSAAEATAAAKASVPLVFTYDYRYPDRDKGRALQVLTGDLRSQYEDLWAKAIGPNLEKSKGFAKTTSATAGVACVSDDGERVGVLVVLDSEAGNVKQTQKLTLAFTATMVDKDGDWLIEKIDGWDPRGITTAAEGQTPSDSPTSGAPDDGSVAAGDADCAGD